jgi:hypothetical protein
MQNFAASSVKRMRPILAANNRVIAAFRSSGRRVAA